MITINVSGNITADAIERNINGRTVLSFSVASNRKYKTKDGELKEETTFIFCNLWNRPEAAKVLTKGRGVTVAGLLNVRNHVGSDGVIRPFNNVRVSSFQLFGRRPAAPVPVVAGDPIPQQPIEQPDAISRPNNEEPIDDLPF